MVVSYNWLWKFLIDKGLSRTDMRKAAGIASNTLTKMKKGEDVSLRFFGKICKALDCNLKIWSSI